MSTSKNVSPAAPLALPLDRYTQQYQEIVQAMQEAVKLENQVEWVSEVKRITKLAVSLHKRRAVTDDPKNPLNPAQFPFNAPLALIRQITMIGKEPTVARSLLLQFLEVKDDLTPLQMAQAANGVPLSAIIDNDKSMERAALKPSLPTVSPTPTGPIPSRVASPTPPTKSERLAPPTAAVVRTKGKTTEANSAQEVLVHPSNPYNPSMVHKDGTVTPLVSFMPNSHFHKMVASMQKGNTTAASSVAAPIVGDVAHATSSKPTKRQKTSARPLSMQKTKIGVPPIPTVEQRRSEVLKKDPKWKGKARYVETSPDEESEEEAGPSDVDEDGNEMVKVKKEQNEEQDQLGWDFDSEGVRRSKRKKSKGPISPAVVPSDSDVGTSEASYEPEEDEVKEIPKPKRAPPPVAESDPRRMPSDPYPNPCTNCVERDLVCYSCQGEKIFSCHFCQKGRRRCSAGEEARKANGKTKAAAKRAASARPKKTRASKPKVNASAATSRSTKQKQVSFAGPSTDGSTVTYLRSNQLDQRMDAMQEQLLELQNIRDALLSDRRTFDEERRQFREEHRITMRSLDNFAVQMRLEAKESEALMRLEIQRVHDSHRGPWFLGMPPHRESVRMSEMVTERDAWPLEHPNAPAAVPTKAIPTMAMMPTEPLIPTTTTAVPAPMIIISPPTLPSTSTIATASSSSPLPPSAGSLAVQECHLPPLDADSITTVSSPDVATPSIAPALTEEGESSGPPELAGAGLDEVDSHQPHISTSVTALADDSTLKTSTIDVEMVCAGPSTHPDTTGPVTGAPDIIAPAQSTIGASPEPSHSSPDIVTLQRPHAIDTSLAGEQQDVLDHTSSRQPLSPIIEQPEPSSQLTEPPPSTPPHVLVDNGQTSTVRSSPPPSVPPIAVLTIPPTVVPTTPTRTPRPPASMVSNRSLRSTTSNVASTPSTKRKATSTVSARPSKRIRGQSAERADGI